MYLGRKISVQDLAMAVSAVALCSANVRTDRGQMLILGSITKTVEAFSSPDGSVDGLLKREVRFNAKYVGRHASAG